MSSKSRNPLLTFLLSYHVWVTSKIQVNFRFKRYWWYCLINSWHFQTIHVFEVRESIADISTELPCLSYLKNLGQLPVWEVLMILSYEFLKFFTLFVFSRSGNPLLIFLQSYCVWITSKIQVDSPKHGSSVEILAMDSLTSKTWIVWKFQKFIRQNHQYLSNRKLTWILEVTQTSWLSRNVSNGSLDLENIKFWANRLNSFWVSKENVPIW